MCCTEFLQITLGSLKNHVPWKIKTYVFPPLSSSLFPGSPYTVITKNKQTEFLVRVLSALEPLWGNVSLGWIHTSLELFAETSATSCWSSADDWCLLLHSLELGCIHPPFISNRASTRLQPLDARSRGHHHRPPWSCVFWLITVSYGQLRAACSYRGTTVLPYMLTLYVLTNYVYVVASCSCLTFYWSLSCRWNSHSGHRRMNSEGASATLKVHGIRTGGLLGARMAFEIFGGGLGMPWN